MLLGLTLSIKLFGIVWFRSLNKSHFSQINSLFKRAYEYGYVKSVINLEQLYSRIMMTTCSLNQSMETCIISASQSHVYLL